MSRNLITEYSAANDISETSSKTLCGFQCGHLKEFDITIVNCQSHGMNTTVFTGPFGDSSIGFSQTTIASTKACQTKRHTIRNNNFNYCWIEAEATAAARETSSSHIRIIVASIEREN